MMKALKVKALKVKALKVKALKVKALKVKALKKLWKRFEAAMAAVAFAEEGEIEAARQIMSEARGDEAGKRQRDEPHRPAIAAVPVARPISPFLGTGVERRIGGSANAP